MTENLARPKNADGTVDWETIFERPGSGLITLVEQAKSLDGLRACAMVIIDQLFTRKNDEAERERQHKVLRELIAAAENNGELESARADVIRMLRSIKQERLLKAAAYAANKGRRKFKRKTGDDERRDEEVLRQMFGAGKPLMMIAGGLTVLVVVIIGVALYFGGQSGPSYTPEPAPVAEVTKPIEKTETPVAKPAQPSKPAEAAPLYPKTIHFRPMFRTISTTRMQKSYSYYQASVVVANKDAYRRVCTRIPALKDAFNMALAHAHPERGKASGQDLAKANAWAMQHLAKKIGAGIVERVDFYMDGNSEFRPRAVPCR
ncbi:MAG: hypothetical protein HOH04_16445 [Rhodospirillaceae bacterium]|nr:hypothetical protein [Rhodospirillaceae bacterium]